MRSSVIRKYALAALCGAAMFGVNQSAQAATWLIDGGQAPASTATYGTDNGDNNVINNPTGAAIYDDGPPFGTTVVAGANLKAVFSGAYNVSWFYPGSESDNKNLFLGPGVIPASGFAETDINQQCTTCASPPSGPDPIQFVGSATNQTDLFPLFRFEDSVDHSGVNNTGNNLDDSGQPNFLLSYLEFRNGDQGFGFYLTATPTDLILMGFNDTGAADDNHDDHMIIGQISDAGNENTPIPGALPLFATVLGGGFLFRRLRNRRQAKSAA